MKLGSNLKTFAEGVGGVKEYKSKTPTVPTIYAADIDNREKRVKTDIKRERTEADIREKEELQSNKVSNTDWGRHDNSNKRSR